MPQTPRTSRRAPDALGVRRPRRAPYNPGARQAPRAFTLTELLVVIGIIVLVLALAVPMFNIMQGDRSVEGGQNVLSAMLQRARARAIGMQERRGLFFFEDPSSGQYMMCLVKTQPYFLLAGRPPVNALELDPQDSEAVPLARGVGIAAAYGVNPSSTTTDNQKYLPYGVVMFDGLGRIEPTQFSIVNTNNDTFEIERRFPQLPVTGTFNRTSTNAVVLFDKAAFPRQAGDDPNRYTTDHWNWLDQNALALVVNRYNGTLIRGE